MEFNMENWYQEKLLQESENAAAFAITLLHSFFTSLAFLLRF